MKIKHSKYRNTGLLFELLTRQVAADILEEKQDVPALRIIKKYFTDKNSVLLKELKLYTVLLEAKKPGYAEAHSLFSTVIDFTKKIDYKKSQQLKYSLIKEIRQSYNENDFFSIKVNNYKELAATYCLFEAYMTSTNINVKEIEQHKITLFEHIIVNTSKKRQKVTKRQKALQEFQSAEKDVQTIAFKLMVEKFNKKHSYLLPEQKVILKEYINSVSSKSKLVNYINEEQKKIVTAIKDIKTKDSTLTLKLNEVVKSLKPLTMSQRITDSHIISLLQCYDLITNVKKYNETIQSR